MKVVVEAYTKLLSQMRSGEAKDDSVVRNVEKFTIEELMNDAAHAVFSVIVELDSLVEDGCQRVKEEDKVRGEVPFEGTAVGRGEAKPSRNSGTSFATDVLATDVTIAQSRVYASSFDSIADIKRELQEQNGKEWGLTGRARDRDGIAIGWELVHNATVLCPNYLLGDYPVISGDTVEAVVRLYGEDRYE